MTLQEWPAGAQEHESAVRLAKPVTAEVEAGVGQQVSGGRAAGDQFCGEAGEQFLQGLLPACRQSVQVSAVGDAASVRGCLGQLVPVDHRHLRVAVGEHVGGEQPRHAGADHHGVLSDLPVHAATSSMRRGCARRLLGCQTRSCPVLLSAAGRRPLGPTARPRPGPRPG